MTDTAPSDDDHRPLTNGDLPPAFRRGNTFEGLLPILGYVAGDQIGSRLFSDAVGDRIAIVAMTLAASWAVASRHRRGEGIGWWIPSVAVYFFVRGVSGLIWGETVFLGFGIGLKVALGLAALISVVIGRPLAAELSPLLLPFSPAVRRHLIYFQTMRALTLGYAIYQLVTVGFEIWLLARTESGSGFLLIRTVTGTLSGFVGFFCALAYADRKMRKIPGFDGIIPIFEELGEAIEADRAARKAG